MTNILVRPAEIKDVSSLARIHVQTWQCAYKGQLPDAYLDSLSVAKRTQKWKEAILKQEAHTQILVAERAGAVVGFCFVGYSRDADGDSQTAELWSIYIDVAHMNQGVGSALMKEALSFFKKEGYTRATLWVLDTNEKSRSWYEHKGWRVEGAIKVEEKDELKLREIRYVIEL